jgi:hypothetical protein
MFTVIESNGGVFMGAVLDENGDTLNFNTEQEALDWAEENCAFNWQVISL